MSAPGSPVVPARGDLARATVAIANGQIGVTEHPPGSNRGPQVEAYLAAVGQPPGQPWCAAFVCWCVREAAAQLGVQPKLLKSASAIRLFDRNPHLQIAPDRLTADDLPAVACWDHGHFKGHTGFVVGIDGDRLQTIEGNGSAAGSRTGGEVVALDKRTLSDPQLMGFLRIE